MFLAEDELVLSRVLALELVAATPARSLSQGACTTIRAALLEERWADAVVAWIGATEVAVDVYGAERVWSGAQLDELRTTLELRVSPIFDDPSDA